MVTLPMAHLIAFASRELHTDDLKMLQYELPRDLPKLKDT